MRPGSNAIYLDHDPGFEDHSGERRDGRMSTISLAAATYRL
jgi:hypothetical protein